MNMHDDRMKNIKCKYGIHNKLSYILKSFKNVNARYDKAKN